MIKSSILVPYIPYKARCKKCGRFSGTKEFEDNKVAMYLQGSLLDIEPTEVYVHTYNCTGK